MGFRDLTIQQSYISCGENNIAKAFLVPVLKQAVLYQRSVGYFSSSVLEPIIDGIIALSRKGGKIQLVASPQLSEEDINAINSGYKKREEIIADAFSRDFQSGIEDFDDDRLNLLASLIATNVLDIKIAVTDSLGIYHDKLGILEDDCGNAIAFFGSPNSSINGYQNNYEKIRVAKSWVGSEQERVDDEKNEFMALWNDTNPFVTTYTYSESAKNKILQVLKKRGEGKTPNGNAEPIQLRDYQKDAIQAWVENQYHGFYVMATGTGKTWTAIYSAKELIKTSASMVVICAPYKHLVRQWAEDVEKTFPNAIIIMVSSENHSWEQQLTQAIVRQRLKKDTQIIVISTITSFNLERFKHTIAKSKQDKLLIVDEAHRFTKRPDELKDQYRFMLGLSATPFSGKDTAKGQELMAYFGGQVFDLPIEKALDKGFLVKYYYYPLFVYASDAEEESFRKRSAQIAGCFRNGVCIDPENLALHLRARLRIISMAQEKVERIDEILDQVNEKDHFIVYCGDGRLHDDSDEEIRHIQFVKKVLSKRGLKASQFTASENMAERMDLVELFNDGDIDVLAAIRCLDEGINIPSIKGALILSSNDDYREFVQRRGRILRTYGDKKHANIYDVIVLPSYETPKMAEIELRRFYEYARLAENKDDLLKQISSIAAKYGLEEQDYIATFDDAKEADLDD